MGRASRTKRERRAEAPTLSGEEIEALIRRREADQQARVKRAEERLQAIEAEEQVTLVMQPRPVPMEPGQVGLLKVVAQGVFIPRELIRQLPPPESQPLSQQPTQAEQEHHA